jgi:UDP-N-acetylglucosamine 1-carboxyvinyltransferase
MSKFIIKGQKKLKGEISVKGAKNNALKIIPAALLTEEKITIHNLPNIIDVQMSLDLLKSLGAEIERIDKNSVTIEAKNIKAENLDSDVARKIRASIMFVAPLLHRSKKVSIPHPGGCVIGKRPIDLFIDFFEKIGAEFAMDDSDYIFKNEGLKGIKYVFTKISHTGTESLMIAAAMAEGETEIMNAACEPEVEALADFLNSMGAKIKGAGTPNIVIEGVQKLHGTEFTIIPDRIEAGSLLCIGAATKSLIKITDCNPKHLEIPLKILKQIGVKLEIGSDYIEILSADNLQAINISTHEYPGFPTDLQSCYTVLLTQAKGMSMVHETIYESRLFFTDLLSRMNADLVLCDPHRVVINGPSDLVAKKVVSPDIRAGLAMLIAGLIAEGQTEIDNIEQIDRGYEDIDKRLNALGAEIERV